MVSPCFPGTRALLAIYVEGADVVQAAVTGQPAALAAALRVVDDTVPEERRLGGMLPVDEEYAPAVLYRLLSTHPPVEERVARLRGMVD